MNCSMNIDHYPDNSTYVSYPLVVYGIVHNYLVFVLGTIANSVALWCISRCTKTNVAMKLLMMSVFASLLVICLITRPVMAERLIGILYCDMTRLDLRVLHGFTILYAFCAQFELAAIAVVAVCRAVAVWASNAHVLRLRVAVGAVVGIFIYSFATSVFLLGPMMANYIKDQEMANVANGVYFFLNTFVPIITTMSCYVAMIIAMRRNGRRMAKVQSSHSRVVNNATRGMFAVFVSNLVFGIPHSVYHMLPRPSLSFSIIAHILFYTHFVVDPFVFMYFNHSYRRRVGERLWAAWVWVVGRCGAPTPKTPAPLTTSTTTSSGGKETLHRKDQLAEQNV
ncbi:uncharacterized protein LOC125030730 isoform X1 [Penaeus chinensis]|uniref:uncharacterized protein LOC125030730 isoform X1 n=1 Tax=Penaeus chinensis TaxID=139456 RepID=UPI001FB57039|nr:uncharacterized protein LOC125030730 isoform X1 [Penaeus chinensis]